MAAPAFGVVVKECQGLVLRLHDGIDLAVVVQVADGEAAAEVQGFDGSPIPGDGSVSVREACPAATGSAFARGRPADGR